MYHWLTFLSWAVLLSLCSSFVVVPWPKLSLPPSYGAADTRMRSSNSNQELLLEDAPDVKGQTIGHWSEEEGSIRWALVEPDLLVLKKEERDLEDACGRLERRADAIGTLQTGFQEETVAFTSADLDHSGDLDFEEWLPQFAMLCAAEDCSVDDLDDKEAMVNAARVIFDEADADGNGKVSLIEFLEYKVLKQLVALKIKAEVLRNTIQQYEPDKHASECIAVGGQGSILVGKDLATGERVAIKVEKVGENGESNSLLREFNVLDALKDDSCFPNVLHYGRQMLNSAPSPTDCNVMVMQLLGADLSTLWWDTTRGSRGFNAATCLVLGVRMLELIEKLHDKGFIHRDIKPANFMMSGDGGKGSGKLCLIDFGLSVPFEKEKKREKEESTSSCSSIRGKKFYGTILFASVNALYGDAQSYRDDLEALIYVLAYFMNGGLPWDEGRKLDADITAKTKKWVVDNIVAGESSEGSASLVRLDSGAVITELLTHCRALSFDERPDYAWCQAELVKAYIAATGREEIIEDWEWNHPSGQQKTPAVEFMDGFLDFI